MAKDPPLTCENCGHVVILNWDTGDYSHLHRYKITINCPHAWPQGLPHPEPGEFLEPEDHARLMAQARSMLRHPSTRKDR